MCVRNHVTCLDWKVMREREREEELLIVSLSGFGQRTHSTSQSLSVHQTVSRVARQSGHSVISNGPPFPAPSALHFNVVPSITLAPDLPSGSLLGPRLTGNSWKVSCPPLPPAPPAPFKEPIKQCCNANSESKESEGQVSGAEGMSV